MKLFKKLRNKRGYVMILIAFSIPIIFMGVNYLIKLARQQELSEMKRRSIHSVADAVISAYNPSLSFNAQQDILYSAAATALNDAGFGIWKKMIIEPRGMVSYSPGGIQNSTNKPLPQQVYELSKIGLLPIGQPQFIDFDGTGTTTVYKNNIATINNAANINKVSLKYKLYAKGNSNSESLSYYEYSKDDSKLKLEFDSKKNVVICTSKAIKKKIYAYLPYCQADIVLALPTNFEACASNDGNAISYGTYAPNTQIKIFTRAYEKFLMDNFYNIGGMNIGVIPYSGKLSVNPDKINQYAKASEHNFSKTKTLVKQIIAYNTIGLEGCDLETKNSKDINSLLTDNYGSGIMCRLGMNGTLEGIKFNAGNLREVKTYVDGETSEETTEVSEGFSEGGQDQAGIDSLLLSNDDPSRDDKYRYRRMWPRPCYLGHCNIVSSLCEKNCPTFQANPFFVYELTNDMGRILNYLRIIGPYDDSHNRSNFVFLPFHWAGNLFSNWMTSSSMSPSASNKKKYVIVIVNKPSTFEPRELTYLGFNNDYAAIPMFESDAIVFKVTTPTNKAGNAVYTSVKGGLKFEQTSTGLNGAGKSEHQDCAKGNVGKTLGKGAYCNGRFKIKMNVPQLLRIKLTNSNSSVSFPKDNRGEKAEYVNKEYIIKGTKGFNFAGPRNFIGWRSNVYRLSNYKTTGGINFGHNLTTKKLKVELRAARITKATISNQILRYYGDYSGDSSLIKNSDHIDPGEIGKSGKEHKTSNRADPCIWMPENSPKRNGWTMNGNTIGAYNFHPACFGMTRGRFVMATSFAAQNGLGLLGDKDVTMCTNYASDQWKTIPRYGGRGGSDVTNQADDYYQMFDCNLSSTCASYKYPFVQVFVGRVKQKGHVDIYTGSKICDAYYGFWDKWLCRIFPYFTVGSLTRTYGATLDSKCSFNFASNLFNEYDNGSDARIRYDMTNAKLESVKLRNHYLKTSSWYLGPIANNSRYWVNAHWTTHGALFVKSASIGLHGYRNNRWEEILRNGRYRWVWVSGSMGFNYNAVSAAQCWYVTGGVKSAWLSRFDATMDSWCSLTWSSSNKDGDLTTNGIKVSGAKESSNNASNTSGNIYFSGRGDVEVKFKVNSPNFSHALKNFFFLNNDTKTLQGIYDENKSLPDDLLYNKGVYFQYDEGNQQNGWLHFCGDANLNLSIDVDANGNYMKFIDIKDIKYSDGTFNDISINTPVDKNATVGVANNVNQIITGETELYILPEQITSKENDEYVITLDLSNCVMIEAEISNRQYKINWRPDVKIIDVQNEDAFDSSKLNNNNDMMSAIKYDHDSSPTKQYMTFKVGAKGSFKVQAVVPYAQTEGETNFLYKTGNFAIKTNSARTLTLDGVLPPKICYVQISPRSTLGLRDGEQIDMSSSQPLTQVILEGNYNYIDRSYFNYMCQKALPDKTEAGVSHDTNFLIPNKGSAAVKYFNDLDQFLEQGTIIATIEEFGTPDTYYGLNVSNGKVDFIFKNQAVNSKKKQTTFSIKDNSIREKLPDDNPLTNNHLTKTSYYGTNIVVTSKILDGQEKTVLLSKNITQEGKFWYYVQDGTENLDEHSVKKINMPILKISTDNNKNETKKYEIESKHVKASIKAEKYFKCELTIPAGQAAQDGYSASAVEVIFQEDFKDRCSAENKQESQNKNNATFISLSPSPSQKEGYYWPKFNDSTSNDSEKNIILSGGKMYTISYGSCNDCEASCGDESTMTSCQNTYNEALGKCADSDKTCQDNASNEFDKCCAKVSCTECDAGCDDKKSTSPFIYLNFYPDGSIIGDKRSDNEKNQVPPKAPPYTFSKDANGNDTFTSSIATDGNCSISMETSHYKRDKWTKKIDNLKASNSDDLASSADDSGALQFTYPKNSIDGGLENIYVSGGTLQYNYATLDKTRESLDITIKDTNPPLSGESVSDSDTSDSEDSGIIQAKVTVPNAQISIKYSKNENNKTKDDYMVVKSSKKNFSATNCSVSLQESVRQGEIGYTQIDQNDFTTVTKDIIISADEWDFIPTSDFHYTVTVPCKNITVGCPRLILDTPIIVVQSFEQAFAAQKQDLQDEDAREYGYITSNVKSLWTWNGTHWNISTADKYTEFKSWLDKALSKQNRGDFFIILWDQQGANPGIKWATELAQTELKDNDTKGSSQINDPDFGKYITEHSFSGTVRWFWPYGTYCKDKVSFSFSNINNKKPVAGIFAGFTLPVNCALYKNGYQKLSGGQGEYLDETSGVSQMQEEALHQLSRDACQKLINNGVIVYVIKYGNQDMPEIDAMRSLSGPGRVSVYGASDEDSLNQVLFEIANDIKTDNKTTTIGYSEEIDI